MKTLSTAPAAQLGIHLYPGPLLLTGRIENMTHGPKPLNCPVTVLLDPTWVRICKAHPAWQPQ